MASLLLLSGMGTGVAYGQKSSCGDAAASQSSSTSKSGSDGGSKANSDSHSDSKDGKHKADPANADTSNGGRGGADSAKAGAKGCSTDKSKPCVDAPQPKAAAASPADQFAFPEDISRKAADAAGSGLPDNPASEPPDHGAPNAPGAGVGAGRADGAAAAGNPASGAGAAGGPSQGAAPNGGNPFPMPTGKAASTSGWGGLRRRSTDPNDPQGSTPADTSSSSSSSGPNRSGSNGPPAHDSPSLQLEDAGSSGQMIDSYRAEKDDDVADFYNKNGNYLGAYMRYQDAVHFNPDDEPAQYGLAEMAQKLGHTQEAIEHYQAYLKMAPSGDKAKDADRALKRLGIASSK